MKSNSNSNQTSTRSANEHVRTPPRLKRSLSQMVLSERLQYHNSSFNLHADCDVAVLSYA